MKMMVHWILLWLSFLGFAAQTRAEETPLILGVHPFKPATTLLESFTPLANELAARIGRPVIVKISRQYDEHIKLVGGDALDIAYMGPAPYVKMKDAFGAKRLLARQQIGSSPVFHGKIFVRADSMIQTLAEVRDKRIALGDPSSTMSNVVPRAMLLQAGLSAETLAKAEIIKDHVNIVLAVLTGTYDVGAVKEDVFFEHEKRGLRAIATSPPISDHLFVASNSLDEKTVEAARAALLSLAGRPEGQAIMNAIASGMTAFVPVADQDYDSLRGILKTLKNSGGTP